MKPLWNSPLGKTLIVLALLATGLVAFGLASGSAGQAVQVQSVAIDRSGATRASIELRPEIGTLLLRPASADRELLLSGTIETRPRDRLHQDVTGTSLRNVALRTTSGLGIHVSVTGPVWQLDLAKDVPTDLDVYAQVGRLDLDLRGTSVETLNVRTETGRTRVHVPSGDVSGVLATELGDIVVYVPREANANIRVHRTLGLLNVHRDFTRERGVYRLEGTGPTIDLVVQNSAGAITLETY